MSHGLVGTGKGAPERPLAPPPDPRTVSREDLALLRFSDIVFFTNRGFVARPCPAGLSALRAQGVVSTFLAITYF